MNEKATRNSETEIQSCTNLFEILTSGRDRLTCIIVKQVLCRW